MDLNSKSASRFPNELCVDVNADGVGAVGVWSKLHEDLTVVAPDVKHGEWLVGGT